MNMTQSHYDWTHSENDWRRFTHRPVSTNTKWCDTSL